jgi:hypothetical protein
MKWIKNPVILIISLIVLTLISSLLFFSVTHFGGQTAIDLIFEAIPAFIAATVLRLVYFKVNKEPIPFKTKMIIVAVYFLLQFTLAIVLNIVLMHSENIIVTLAIQAVIQLIYSAVLYLCLS